jgi:hypothetical protein
MTMKKLTKRSMLPALLSIPILATILGLTPLKVISSEGGDCAEFCCPFPTPEHHCLKYFLENCPDWEEGCEGECGGFQVPFTYYCLGICTYTEECHCETHFFDCYEIEH